MVKQIKRGGGRMKTAYWSLVSMASAMLISLQPVMADTIWNRFSTIMKDVYGQLVGISTIVAVTAAAIALIVRMISRNQRAVDEATSWLKRIVVTWIVLNSLGGYRDEAIGRLYGRCRSTINHRRNVALKQLRKEWERLEHEEQKADTF